MVSDYDSSFIFKIIAIINDKKILVRSQFTWSIRKRKRVIQYLLCTVIILVLSEPYL